MQQKGVKSSHLAFEANRILSPTSPIDTEPPDPYHDMPTNIVAAPLNNLDEWEEDVKTRYPEPGVPAFNATDPKKKEEQFRDYARTRGRAFASFIATIIRTQSYDLSLQKRNEFLGLNNRNR